MVPEGFKKNNEKVHLAQRLNQNFASKLFSYYQPSKIFLTISVDGPYRPDL